MLLETVEKCDFPLYEYLCYFVDELLLPSFLQRVLLTLQLLLLFVSFVQFPPELSHFILKHVILLLLPFLLINFLAHVLDHRLY